MADERQDRDTIPTVGNPPGDRATGPNLGRPGSVDPITGTTPTGPLSEGDPEARASHWSLAAKWFIFVLLAFVFFAALAYFLGE